MAFRRLLLLLLFALPALAQEPCTPTPMYSPCEFVFELNAQEAAQHPNPYVSVQLQAEFRSPRKRTFLMPAYWDGGNRMVIRFTPVETGEWDYRVTSNIARFQGQMAKFTSTASSSPGFVRTANKHHWAFTESDKPHLWQGDSNYRFAAIGRAEFEQFAAERARLKFNHLRGIVTGGAEDAATAFPAPDQPNPAWFQEVDRRILLFNKLGITFDLMMAGGGGQLVKLCPTWHQRERYVRYLVARYSAMDITWQGVQNFEEYDESRTLLKEVGMLLKKLDPYQHPRSTSARISSAPLLADGWMDYVVYQSHDDQLGAIEHQLYSVPFVNAGVDGANASPDVFRKHLWNATMNGQYPSFYQADPANEKALAAWREFMTGTRYWDLEPFFDLDGGRSMALEEVEYIIYVEKPTGPVEVRVGQHGYDVAWFNPLTGESLKQKNYKGERFAGDPPGKEHDWILMVSREGKKQSMLNSYKFESRVMPVQEIEVNTQKTPVEIAAPGGDEISLSKPFQYAVKVKRETRATRSMMYLWTGDVTIEGQGYRVLATGSSGTLRIDPQNVARIARQYPAILNLRVLAMNIYGKVYMIDKVFRLVQ